MGILGGSLAGIALADRLAAAGVTVCLWEEHPALARFAWRCPGFVLTPQGEHPSRLAGSMGEVETAAIFSMVSQTRALLLERGLFEPTGSLHHAGMAGEVEEIERSLALLRRLGLPVEPRTAPDSPWASQGLGPGYLLPEDGRVDTRSLVLNLVDEARAAGAMLLPGARVRAFGLGGSGPWVEDELGRVELDALVLAGGAELGRLDGFLADSLLPVRHQWLLTEPLPEPLARSLPRTPMLAQHELSSWCLDHGRMQAGGARFASVEMEAGETDDGGVNPLIQRVLAANLGRFFPLLESLRAEYAWTAIATHTCDGLPLVGPLPGRGRLLACTGFHAQESGLALAAAEAIAAGLLDRPGPALPRCFQPTRLL